MTDLTTRRFGLGLGAFTLGLVGVSVVLLGLDWTAIVSLRTSQIWYFLGASITAVLGMLIVARRPNNPIGWLLLAIGLADGLYLFGYLAAIRGQLSGASTHGLVAWFGLLFNTGQSVGAILLLILILFFPTGRLLPGSRQKGVAIFVMIAAGLTISGQMVAVNSIQLSPRLPAVSNPIGIPALDPLTNNNSGFQSLLFLLLFAVLGVVVVIRFRRSRGVERKQMRWFAYVAGAVLLIFIATFFPPLENWGTAIDNTTLGVGLAVALPLTIGLAVIKYGLYDIDLFISRSIVYATLAVFITAIYVGIAVGIGSLIGSGGKPNLALSIVATAIVALGFQPVRERVQRIANRLVFGPRANPYEVLSEFSSRVAETYAADEVLPRMAQVLQAGASSESATVWLLAKDELRPAASWPAEKTPEGPLGIRDQIIPQITGSALTVAVRHQDELLGALSVNKRRGETLTPIEEKLVTDLAHQAGLVLKNVGLTNDLQARLEELRASRQRLVMAQDEERRKLERNLHDGAQQYLVAIKVKLGLVEMLAGKDIEKAKATLVGLKADADEALETLRDTARGIYPPLLADRGLVVALQSQANKATLPVTIEDKGVQRYSPDIEATVYFCVMEALQNIQKYAQAKRVTIALETFPGGLQYSVQDDGTGFDQATVQKGAGLTNMTDRLDALGGTLKLRSAPGQGTTLVGRVPTLALGVAR